MDDSSQQMWGLGNFINVVSGFWSDPFPVRDRMVPSWCIGKASKERCRTLTSLGMAIFTRARGQQAQLDAPGVLSDCWLRYKMTDSTGCLNIWLVSKKGLSDTSALTTFPLVNWLFSTPVPQTIERVFAPWWTRECKCVCMHASADPLCNSLVGAGGNDAKICATL